MNYIKQVNAFNEYCLYNEITTSEIALWHALMCVNNKCMWKQEFSAANSILMNLSGCDFTRKQLEGARNRLKQRALISYNPAGGRRAGSYSIRCLYEDEAFDNEHTGSTTGEPAEEEEGEEQAHSRDIRGTFGVPINKHKQKLKQKQKESKAKTKKRFVPPALEEVMAYCKEKGYDVDAQVFISFYESKNWMVGANKMTSWKSAVAGWAARDKKETGKVKPMLSDIAERDYSEEELKDMVEDPLAAYMQAEAAT